MPQASAPVGLPPWKGISPALLSIVAITVDATGVAHIPCRGIDGTVLRTHVVAPGRAWWADDGDGVHLFGVEQLARADHATPILICEGESDALAAREHLRGLIAISAPGAHTFRPEWRALVEPFALVYVVGDGDAAGRDFTWSVRRAVPWARPVICPEGRDLRDLLQSGDGWFVHDLLDAADAWARIEHAFLHAADLDECERWLREGIPA